MRTIINTAAKFIHLLIASFRICIQPRMLNLSANSYCIYWCCLLFVHSQMRQHLHFPTSYLLHCDVMSVFLYILRCANIAAKGADVWWLLPEMVCLFWGKEMFKFCCRKHFYFLSFNRWAAEFWLWWEGGSVSRWGAVNALPTGRRRATKEATAYSKATAQLLSHAKHSNVLCKGWADRELREGLSHEGHLKHRQTKLEPLCLMHPDIHGFACFSVCIPTVRKWD